MSSKPMTREPEKGTLVKLQGTEDRLNFQLIVRSY